MSDASLVATEATAKESDTHTHFGGQTVTKATMLDAITNITRTQFQLRTVAQIAKRRRDASAQLIIA